MNENVIIKFIADHKQFMKATDEMTGRLNTFGRTAHSVGTALKVGLVGGLALVASRSLAVQRILGGVWQQIVRGATNASGFVGGVFGALGLNTSKLLNGAQSGATAIAKQGLGISAAMGLAEKAMIGFGIATVASMGIAVHAAADFEQSMRNVNSILGLSDPQLKGLEKNILSISQTVPQSAKSLAEGMYQVVSSGFTSAEGGAKVIEASAKAATAGLSDTATAATAITTALNSYNMSADKANYVSDLLFQTVNVGVVNFEQLATNLGDFIGIANASGASIEETLALYASITVATGQPARAATSMQAIFRQLLKPSEDLSAALEHMGYQSGPAAVKGMGGVLPVIRELYKEVGSKEGLAPLFQDTEALNGVLALLSRSTGDTDKRIAQFTDRAKVSGVTAKVLAEQSKSWNYQLALLKTSLQATAIQVGQAFLPALEGVTKVVGFFVREIAGLPDGLKKAFGWLTVVSGSLLAFSGGWLMVSTHVKTFRTVLKLLTDTPILSWLKSLAMQLPIVGDAFQSASAKALMFRSALTGIGIILTGVIAGLEIRNAIADPLVQWAIGAKDIGKTAEGIVKAKDSLSGLLETTGKFGKHGEDPIKQFIADVDRMGQGTIGRNLSMGFLKVGVARVDELDKSLASLVQNGHADEAADAFDTLRTSLVGAGVDSDTINKAFNDYLTLIGSTIDDTGTLKESTESMANSAIDKFNKMKEAAKQYDDFIKNRVQDAQSFMGLATALKDIESGHKDAATAAKDEGIAIDGITEATDRLNEARDKGASAQEKINRILYVTNGGPLPGTEAARKLAEAQRELRDSKREEIKATKEQNTESKKTPATLAEITKKIDEQNQSYNTFQDNLRKLALKGLAPEVIDELNSMGQEGADIAKELVGATPKEFDKAKGVLANKARMQGEEYQRELDRQLKLSGAVARLGTNATVTAIIKEMENLAPGMKNSEQQVYDAAKAIGIKITQGITDGILSLTLPGGTALGISVLAPGSVGAGGLSAGAVGAGALGPQANLSSGAVGAGALQRDAGGPLPPGLSAVYNGTGKTEWVFTADQLRQLTPMIGSGPAASTSHSVVNKYQFGNIYANDYTDIMRKADRAKRLKALEGANA